MARKLCIYPNQLKHGLYGQNAKNLDQPLNTGAVHLPKPDSYPNQLKKRLHHWAGLLSGLLCRKVHFSARLGIPLLALIGALLALGVVFWSQRKVPTPPIAFMPPTAPYADYIAGTGVVEASSENIFIGSPFNEIVTAVYVKAGDSVSKGAPLFKLDTRSFEAKAAALRTTLLSAEITYAERAKQFSFYERLQDPRAVSEQAFSQARYAMEEAQNNVKVARANLVEAQIDIERSIVRAPVEGEILQVNIRVGELAPINPYVSGNASSAVQSQGSLILMGTIHPLQMRVDINEEDSWRYKRGAPATAFVRGNSRMHLKLNYLRLEPYLVPKTSFTGQNTERLDTRVLQVLYTFEKGDLPIYTGQILDVFIEASKS